MKIPQSPLSLLTSRSGYTAFAIASAALAFSPTAVRAAAQTWTNTSGDQLWSNTANFNLPGSPAGNDITFDATGSSATVGTVTNIVDSSFSLTSLTYTNTGTATHTTQINSGVTLSAGTLNENNTAAASNVTITGPGSLSVTGFSVGTASPGAATSTQTLSLSGLSSFTANIAGTMSIGTGARASGTVTLGSSNAITATTISLGGNTSTGGNLSTLNLGQSNTINTDTFNVGGGRSSAAIQFTTGLTGATATIRNAAGTGAATLNASTTATNASGIGSGTVDFSGGTVDALFSNVNLGTSANSTAGGSGTGTLTFGLGTLTATSMNVGNGSTGTTTTATGFGVVNMNANAGTLTATTVTLGKLQTGARSNSASGTFNQNGGTAVITNLKLADGTSNTGAGMTTTGIYNLAAGTLKAGSIAPGTNGSGVATYVRTFNWTGGTIENLDASTDLTISQALTLGNTGGTQTFLADTSRSILVNAAIGETSAGSGFIKSGAGTLSVSSTSTYTGLTNVTGGTLATTGTGTLGGNVTLANAAGVTLTLGSAVSFADTAILTFSSINGVINMNFSGNDVIGGVTNGTLTLGNGTYTASQLNSFFGGSSFVDSGALGGTLTVVPEPSTYAIAFGGFALLICLQRGVRRSRQS